MSKLNVAHVLLGIIVHCYGDPSELEGVRCDVIKYKLLLLDGLL
jgi:hypothetical protein